MAVQDIKYATKSAITENPLIPLPNQVTAGDMNEIKDVVNNNGVELTSQVATLSTSITLNAQNITQVKSDISGIIADMNDFNMDINANFRTFVVPANSSLSITLDRGIYLTTGSIPPGPQYININDTNNIWLVADYDKTKETTRPWIEKGTFLIYSKSNVFSLNTVGNLRQSKIPILEITSFTNSSASDLQFSLTKIKSFN